MMEVVQKAYVLELSPWYMKPLPNLPIVSSNHDPMDPTAFNRTGRSLMFAPPSTQKCATFNPNAANFGTAPC